MHPNPATAQGKSSHTLRVMRPRDAAVQTLQVQTETLIRAGSPAVQPKYEVILPCPEMVKQAGSSAMAASICLFLHSTTPDNVHADAFYKLTFNNAAEAFAREPKN